MSKESEKTGKRLRNYAEWYVLKYSPSKKRLLSKLLLRAADESEAKAVFSEIERFLDDQASIRTEFENRLALGKGMRGFRSKLLLKGFSKDDIEAVSAEFSESVADWPARRPSVERKMRSHAAKGRSRMEAQAMLRAEFPEFSEEIAELVRSEYPEDTETLILLQDTKPDVFRGSEKAIFDRLARKGFRYSDVRKVLGAE
jgi:SOS response regulatory protein OraA/RecX